MNRIEFHDLAESVADKPSSRLPSPLESALRRLDDYIRRDETSLARQRAILCESAGPARAMAEATVAEYEQSLEVLRRRRIKLLARAYGE